MRRRPELLAPAGTPEKLRMVFAYGADAAYLGGEQFGLRAFGGNFSPDEMRTAVRLAHASGKKIYVTVNVFPHNEDINALPDYFTFLTDAGVDAVLIADLGVAQTRRSARRTCAGTVARRDSRDSQEYGCRARDVRPWLDVHFLFGTLSPQ